MFDRFSDGSDHFADHRSSATAIDHSCRATGVAAANIGARIGAMAGQAGGAIRNGVNAIKNSWARTARGCACFDDDTRVSTENGSKRIADIEVGEKVLARNEATNEQGYFTVTATHQTYRDHTLAVVLRIEDREEIIETTSDHPFYDVREGFVEASQLVAGDWVALADGGYATVLRLETRVVGQFVYNLTVDQAHTYFVGDAQVWVHNCPPNVVYRGLAKGENPAAGLSARAPGAGNSPISHVAGKRDTQWISTTKDLSTALNKFGQNGVVSIDLNKVTSEVLDVSGGFARGGRMTNYARRDQEVLIRDFISPDAIIERIK